jgi:hypothetical protein
MRLLGRREPTDWRHVETHPLTLLTAPTEPVPCVLGINWYDSFDNPVKVGSRYYIGLDHKNLGSVRGGHAICVKPAGVTDAPAWRGYYRQIGGSCVGFSESRMMSLLNRRRYDALWLYKRAQQTDEFADTPPAEGTSVRAGLDILRTEGHRRVVEGVSRPVELGEGIQVFRWALEVEDILATLGYSLFRTAIPLLQSWGSTYPRMVLMPLETVDRLLRESGECAVPTDR